MRSCPWPRRPLLPFDALVGVDRQSLPGVRIDNGQGTQAPTIEQGIRDEVHRPQLVRGQRRWLLSTGTEVFLIVGV